MSLGIPLKLLHESQGHTITLELSNGSSYRGKLDAAEDNMNVQLRDVTYTARDGRVSHLDRVYIRGSHVRFFMVPDMLKQAPMFKRTPSSTINANNDSKRRGSWDWEGKGDGHVSCAWTRNVVQTVIMSKYYENKKFMTIYTALPSA